MWKGDPSIWSSSCAIWATCAHLHTHLNCSRPSGSTYPRGVGVQLVAHVLFKDFHMAGSSLFALLDDIATLLDDISLMSKVAAKKSASVLSDDLAVNAE